MTEILMFHRVLPKIEINIDDAYFIRGTLVSQERLEEVIVSYISKGFIFKTILTIEDNSDCNQVVLTFDDGYLDNYLYAKPVLDKYNIKATFYPIIGYCIEQKCAPLDYYYQYVNDSIGLENKKDWITGDQKKKFLSLSINEQSEFVTEFCSSESESTVSYMSIKQLIELQNLGHEIGGHSYYHDIYTKLSFKEIVEDIRNTKQAFLQFGINITSYAYTDGQYNNEVIIALKEQKINYSCAIKSHYYTNNKNYELEREFITESDFSSMELFGIKLSALEMDIFLKKIGVLNIGVNLDFLNKFIVQVLSKIPFQNYKMIERGFGNIPNEKNIKEDMLSLNGGTCATMNIFISAVLYEIGFNVTLINGTMMNKNDHIAILLNFEDKNYIIDLGDGQPYFEPISTTKNMIKKHPFRTYRTIKKSKDLVIDFLINGEWLTDITFHLISKTYKQVYKTLEQHYKQKEFGPFWNGVRFAIYPDQSIIAIRDKTFILQKNDLIEKIEIKGKIELEEIVSKYLPDFKNQIVKCFTKQGLL